MKNNKDKIILYGILALFIIGLFSLFFFGKPQKPKTDIAFEKEEMCFLSQKDNKKRIVKLKITRTEGLETPIASGEELIYIDNKLVKKNTFGGFLKDNIFDLFTKIDKNNTEERLFKISEDGIIEGKIPMPYYKIMETQNKKNIIYNKVLKPEYKKDVDYPKEFFIQKIDCEEKNNLK